jgi:glycerophosphoryl diester phosphodiesterase
LGIDPTPPPSNETPERDLENPPVSEEQGELGYNNRATPPPSAQRTLPVQHDPRLSAPDATMPDRTPQNAADSTRAPAVRARLWRALLVLASMAAAGCSDSADDSAIDTGGTLDAAGDADTGTDAATASDATEQSDAADVTNTDGANHDADGSSITLPPRPPASECLRDPACGRIMVAAHRGEHSIYPENSIASIRAAARGGISLAEIDVQVSADGVLVVMHDGTVDRTTDGEGETSSFTWAQLQELLLDGGDPGDPETSRIPTFEQVLAVARAEGISLYIDIKTSRTDLVAQAVHAGNYEDIALLRDDIPAIAPLANDTPELWFLAAVSSMEDVQLALDTFPNLGIVEYTEPFVNSAIVAEIRALGLHVQQDVIAGGDFIGQIGDISGWLEFLNAGVLVPQSDFPLQLLPVVEEWERQQLSQGGD